MKMILKFWNKICSEFAALSLSDKITYAAFIIFATVFLYVNDSYTQLAATSWKTIIIIVPVIIGIGYLSDKLLFVLYKYLPYRIVTADKTKIK